MILTKEDNKILWDMISNFNDSVPISSKISMDVYLNRIEFIGESTMLYGFGITPLIPDGCTIDNVSNVMDVGAPYEMNIDQTGEDIRNILKAFIRELKIKNVLVNEN